MSLRPLAVRNKTLHQNLPDVSVLGTAGLRDKDLASETKYAQCEVRAHVSRGAQLLVQDAHRLKIQSWGL